MNGKNIISKHQHAYKISTLLLEKKIETISLLLLSSTNSDIWETIRFLIPSPHHTHTQFSQLFNFMHDLPLVTSLMISHKITGHFYLGHYQRTFFQMKKLLCVEASRFFHISCATDIISTCCFSAPNQFFTHCPPAGLKKALLCGFYNKETVGREKVKHVVLSCQAAAF